ncbi:hypothetical protein A2331_04140 [Candidatus Falkowbacteria bacterium RIFOXYB2_FULL_34_18]|uniref:Uncharacterized protein n=1 Tax=Candidatus Falkowbacteria bacterium RIFOXYD2_FULL_34_120 TaxID=1798007 RepID=A0A1F5TRW2_9BACT|nr:MAG: hypothetical protein A2331_04140 [Candidatus Falkowbacteria bacterium RIFOXYB2_FULL_34_18]OGF29717.1 MAG: hypothetical protein A2500_00385 [Candidatus Falkowbacteria bacterium RIFOXYC12_FULL_34_55]OGF37418.1 MAG: hypothetical protein A2466_00335 [Candidatus Falkowbacteria bacterium RIFOXYC2_FULL_34_220]OGF39143.1 MAG: hypothetical protein A2515_00290 [Candidatus Falkowbacteria bacterium RIFOXYD12_FULL_34_57]OGF41692.1 MAG: hypothetical protein A2531_06010 [Candidatus Falkowbacteria bact
MLQWLSNLKKILFCRISNANDLSNLPNWRIGLSCAAGWSWGWSLVAGIGMTQKFGILPFLMWLTGNILAVPLMGLIYTYFPSSKKFPKWTIFWLWLFLFSYFCIMINMKALLCGFGGGDDVLSFALLPAPWSSVAVISIALLTIWYIWIGGLRFSVITDLYQYLIQIGCAITLAVVGFFLVNGQIQVQWITESSQSFTSLEWGYFSLFGVLFGAIADGQMWQRFESIEDKNVVSVALWSGLFFSVYMFFVFVTTLFYLSTSIIMGIIFLIAMLALCTSSIDSYIASYEYILKKVNINYHIAFIFTILIVCTWPLTAKFGIFKIWSFMAEYRMYFIGFFVLCSILISFAPTKTNENIVVRLLISSILAALSVIVFHASHKNLMFANIDLYAGMFVATIIFLVLSIKTKLLSKKLIQFCENKKLLLK